MGRGTHSVVRGRGFVGKPARRAKQTHIHTHTRAYACVALLFSIPLYSVQSLSNATIVPIVRCPMTNKQMQPRPKCKFNIIAKSGAQLASDQASATFLALAPFLVSVGCLSAPILVFNLSDCLWGCRFVRLEHEGRRRD